MKMSKKHLPKLDKKTLDCAGKKVAKSIKIKKEEDAESIVTSIPSATPTEINDEKKDNELDNATLEYILQEIKKNKDKQVQDAQADFAYRQQQAQQIVTNIENYLKNNKK